MNYDFITEGLTKSYNVYSIYPIYFFSFTCTLIALCCFFCLEGWGGGGGSALYNPPPPLKLNKKIQMLLLTLFLCLDPYIHIKGKTTLIKALTDEAKMQPEDRLFATLDVTTHPGKLPSGMVVLFLDTVGFVSDLPPELESFSATLEDIVDSVGSLIRRGH